MTSGILRSNKTRTPSPVAPDPRARGDDDDGGEVDAPLLGFAGHGAPAQAMRRAHRHQDFELNYLTEGSIVYLMAGQTLTIPAGRSCFFWAATPHQLVHIKGRGRLYWFTLPTAWVMQWDLPPAAIARLLSGRPLLDPVRADARADQAAADCQRWLADLNDGSAERTRVAQLEIEAKVRRMLLAQRQRRRDAQLRTRPDARPTPTSQAADRAEELAAFVAAHYREPITAGDVARAVGLHPNYAATLFRRHCGATLGQYITQHRCFHARRLLLTTRRKVLDIALDSGFGSLSRFYEAYAQLYGQSPRRDLSAAPASAGAGAKNQMLKGARELIGLRAGGVLQRPDGRNRGED